MKKTYLPLQVGAVILSWISSTSLAPLAFAEDSLQIPAESVIVQKVNLETGAAEFFAVKAKTLLDRKGNLTVEPQKIDAVVTAGQPIPKEKIERWRNVHESDLTRGLQASISLADGTKRPLKDIKQLSSEIQRLAPNGQVAKHIDWSIQHESDLTSGTQSWFWLGFLAGGLTFLGLSYLFSHPAYTYSYAYAAPAPYYYYGVYAPYSPGYYSYGYVY